MKEHLYLDRNERVEPFPNHVMSDIAKIISKIDINLYPEVGLFYEKLSTWLECESNQIFVTEGVSGAIKSIIETITKPGDQIIFPWPSFAMYPVYAEMHQLEFSSVSYDASYKLNINDIYNKISDRTSIVFLPNPNVPIDELMSLDVLSKLSKKCAKHGALLVVDEVYHPFSDVTAIDIFQEHDNLLVMRSFSKAFGLAGTRVGYIVGNQNLVNYVSKTRTGYETNALSMKVVEYFLDNYVHIENHVESVKSGLQYFKNGMRNLEIDTIGGKNSNFVFVALKSVENTNKLLGLLKDEDIYVRGGWGKPLDDGFSVTGASVDTMEVLLERVRHHYPLLREL